MPSQRDLLARAIRDGCRGELRVDESLSRHTTFGVGGPADLFFLPADLEDLAVSIPLIRDAGLPVLPLGGGTNMLVQDVGFRGLVIGLAGGATQIEIREDEGVAQAGASLQVFSRRCQRAGKTGMEFGCGIPGTVGGAVCGNAGAWGGETWNDLVWVRGTDLRSGEEVGLKKAEVPHSYRHAELPDGLLIVEAGFSLGEGDPAEILERMNRMLTERKTSQPLSNRSSGCMFKNPPGSSAGLLIDRAGAKGWSVGNVSVSEVHANFVVNRGGGSASDVLSLVDRVRDRVRQDSGVELELEVRVVGEQGFEEP